MSAEDSSCDDPSPRSLCVVTGARLHFGLLNLRPTETRRGFGGLGMMLASPQVRVRVDAADSGLAVHGLEHERAEKVIARLNESGVLRHVRPFALTVEAAIPPHHGLGSGTQLALAITQAIYAFAGNCLPPSSELAELTGRGNRSAIGLHGFFQGGLLLEAGKLPGEPLSPLVARAEVPNAWRVLLIRPRLPATPGPLGLSGDEEHEAFATLENPPEEVSQRLWGLAKREVLPAARRGDFARMAEAVYQFGNLSGSIFASVQGGAYASARLAEWITFLRESGMAGVGQSSWGPTIFCLASTEDEAQQFADLARNQGPTECDVDISTPSNMGRTIERT